LGVVVLLQSGKGGGLASMGGGAGTDTLIGGRQAATILTKASWICGGSFMALALVLSILSSRAAQPTSVLREEFRQTAPPAQQAPAPAVPGTQPAPQQQNAPAGGTQPQPNQQPQQ
ncbi:MAG TPA: preprotein translocase subunit SecG, partial [Longimicrobiales bacterium]